MSFQSALKAQLGDDVGKVVLWIVGGTVIVVAVYIALEYTQSAVQGAEDDFSQSVSQTLNGITNDLSAVSQQVQNVLGFAP